ncbi:hypothetical protein C4556_02145 [Candidatus Parcubacteria bacterium]|nr:MAG: hypothetical protein C4556_02145 [Candidatus Parcubacteria bacterium]
MAQPARKMRQEPEFQRERVPAKKDDKGGAEIIHLRVAANDNEDAERVAVLSDRDLKKPRADKKMYQAFIRELKLQNKIEHWKVYVPHAEDNVAVARAFPDSEILILEETASEADSLNKRGYDAKRGLAESHRGEDANVVIVLDESLSASWQLLTNVAPGGYLLCHGKMASAVRRLGKYQFRGVFDRDKNVQMMENSVEESEVSEEREFERATDKDSGAVTYDEARDAVKQAFGTTENVLERYKQLIVEAKQKSGEQNSDQTPILELEYTRRDGTVVRLRINTILPLNEEAENKVFVFKKKGNA